MATGAFQRPRVPAFATELDPAIRQLHSSEYRNPSQLADGPVLVVGLSHSGADLAHEIAATHPVILSGKSHGQIPVPLESRRGQLGFSVVPGVHVARRDARHADRPQDGARGQEGRRSPPPLAQARAEGRRRRAHGRRGRPASWTASRCSRTGGCSTSRTSCGAPGFWSDYGWIRPAIKVDEDGWPVQYRGVTDVPGLYFMGLLFQYSFTSMLIRGVGRDAEYVADRIAERVAVRGRTSRPRPDPRILGPASSTGCTVSRRGAS